MSKAFWLWFLRDVLHKPLFPKDQRHIKTKVIDEVVVTALGIKRMNKSLGYAAENKDSKIFEDTQNNNWANALEGKVAGLKSRPREQDH